MHTQASDTIIDTIWYDLSGRTLDLQGVQDRGKRAIEPHVHDGTDDLGHHAGLHKGAGRVGASCACKDNSNEQDKLHRR
jgi:hypothetical protein